MTAGAMAPRSNQIPSTVKYNKTAPLAPPFSTPYARVGTVKHEAQFQPMNCSG
jgi:hypothetical protein